jgi:hypothetical protein
MQDKHIRQYYSLVYKKGLNNLTKHKWHWENHISAAQWRTQDIVEENSKIYNYYVALIGEKNKLAEPSIVW